MNERCLVCMSESGLTEHTKELILCSTCTQLIKEGHKMYICKCGGYVVLSEKSIEYCSCGKKAEHVDGILKR